MPIDAGGRRTRGALMGAAKTAGLEIGSLRGTVKTGNAIPGGFADLEATLAPSGRSLYIEVKAPVCLTVNLSILRPAGRPAGGAACVSPGKTQPRRARPRRVGDGCRQVSRPTISGEQEGPWLSASRRFSVSQDQIELAPEARRGGLSPRFLRGSPRPQRMAGSAARDFGYAWIKANWIEIGLPLEAVERHCGP